MATSSIARLIELPRRAVVCAKDETHLNLLPHVRSSWTPHRARLDVITPDRNRQVTVFGATGRSGSDQAIGYLPNGRSVR